MKKSIAYYDRKGSLSWFPILIVVLLQSTLTSSQVQLDVQGVSMSTDTVVKFRVNYLGSNDVVGLSVRSTPQYKRGIGAYFQGGNRGIYGYSLAGLGVHGYSVDSIGVRGESQNGIGIVGVSIGSTGIFASSHSSTGVVGRSFDFYGMEGQSTNSHGAYFKGKSEGGFADIVLGGTNWYSGGDDGVIMSDPSQSGSDIFLVSNDGIVMKLDHDKNEEGTFEVWNQEDRKVMVMFENGQFEIWDGAASNNRTLLFEPDGDLNIDGALTQGSDENRKEHIFLVDAKKILKSITEMPVYEWQYKGQERRHVGPMAQDFHSAFGLGNDNTTIAALDADGINMAAIKAQQEIIEEQQAELKKLYQKVSELELLMNEVSYLISDGRRRNKARAKKKSID